MYRIYTENINPASIDAAIAVCFSNWSELPAVGYWHGQKEASLVIEIETDDTARVNRVAEAIREVNHQQAVLVTHIASESNLVTGQQADTYTAPAEPTVSMLRTDDPEGLED